MDRAAAAELRRPYRALPGAPGALLAVRLATAAADLAPGLRVVGALPRGGELGHDHLVDQRDVDLNVEHLGGQLHAAGALTARAEDVEREAVAGEVSGSHRDLTLPSRWSG